MCDLHPPSLEHKRRSADSLVEVASPIERAYGFDEALLAHCEGLLSFYQGAPHAGLVLGDIGRLAIIAALLPAGRLSRFEIARRVTGLASRRRVGDHLAILEWAKLVRTEAQGRRVVISVTRELEDLMSAWFASFTNSAISLFPGLEEVAAAPGMTSRFLIQILGGHKRGFDAFSYTPGLARLVTLRGGYLLFLTLLRARQAGERFSSRGFALRFAFSRTHVIDLLDECVALGLVRRDARGRMIHATGLVDEGRRWFAIHSYLTRLSLLDGLIAALDDAGFTPLPKRALVPKRALAGDPSETTAAAA